MLKMWKHSRVRFYLLNLKWNYGFWIFTKKVYKDVKYHVQTGEFIDTTLKIIERKKPKNRRRFVGYMYKGIIYQDNPGIQGIDRETWIAWKKKGLIE